MIASGLLLAGMSLLWDGFLVHLKLQARLDKEVDALGDLAGAAEQLSLDADACTALPRKAAAAELSIPTADGVVRWVGGEKGLERRGPSGQLRRFRSLQARDLDVETVGPRMVLLARLRVPGDDVDTVLARAIPIGAKR